MDEVTGSAELQRSRENLVVFKASKTQFLRLLTQHNLPDNYALFFNDSQLLPSSALYILASMKFGVLRCLRQFSRSSNC
ncbi:hypothetical protein E2C01_034442 [Portunus trituberculatus]|uniref:Uncharacterized protein n=1 Tax=Portunus trituberculatus TaxID=210409 RepID=A0A5B7F6P0_PORTR|nr:hypothetical protein [Portunus trituberculatus]